MEGEGAPVVIDMGSGFIKIQHGGEKHPVTCPNIVGRWRDMSVLLDDGTDRCLVGDMVQPKLDYLNISFPMEHGIVKNWDDFERVYHDMMYNKMKIAPEEHPLLITENPTRLKINREKMTQIMFEVFNIPSMHLCCCPIMWSMYSSGFGGTGVFLDCGDGVTHSGVMVKGELQKNTIQREDYGGRDITEYLQVIQEEIGYEKQMRGTSWSKEYFRMIKEKLCFVAKDYESALEENEMSSKYEEYYVLPDGSEMLLASQRFRAPELLFKPKMCDVNARYGVHELIYRSIEKFSEIEDDVGIKKEELFRHVVLSGGSTKFSGFDDRLREEIEKLRKNEESLYSVNICSRKTSGDGDEYDNVKERCLNVWKGGSILSQMSGFVKDKDKWVSKGVYDEEGPLVIHKKCSIYNN